MRRIVNASIFLTATTFRPMRESQSRCSAPTYAARLRPMPFGATSGTTFRQSHTSSCRRSARSTLNDPFTGRRWLYRMPAGGRGYTRVPSLIGIWSTAPFLLNNSVGPFSEDPSVAGRMKVFETSIEQMLWPMKRDHDPVLGLKVPGVIDRTQERSWLTIPAGFVPESLHPLQGVVHRLAPWLVKSGGDVTIGPVPKGTPIDLIA